MLDNEMTKETLPDKNAVKKHWITPQLTVVSVAKLTNTISGGASSDGGTPFATS